MNVSDSKQYSGQTNKQTNKQTTTMTRAMWWIVGMFVLFVGRQFWLFLQQTSESRRMLVNLESKIDSHQTSCDDEVWCSIEIPTRSAFRFDPPNDLQRWRRAQMRAASGEPVLLLQSMKQFPTFFNFLDGDVLFRSYHKPIDIFLDENTDFSSLSLHKNISPPTIQTNPKSFSWENSKTADIIPPPYHYLTEMNRAPVVKLGYFAFRRNASDPFFSGTVLGEAPLGRRMFLSKWRDTNKLIDTPFILLHSSNENWGLLSTYLPNRTAKWGTCCSHPTDVVLSAFLNDPRTLLLLTNQHVNISHPKLIVLPRGIPILPSQNHKLLWDSMRILRREHKQEMVFTSSSKWGYRPNISACVAQKFSSNELHGRSYDNSLTGRLSPREYYKKLGMSRFSLALPGLGYDTFRYVLLIF
jgi:hypothetical protein